MAWWPLGLYLLLVVVLVVVMIAGSWVLGERQQSRAKNDPYEGGSLPAAAKSTIPFTAQFYLIAMIFVVFDLEAVFFFAWALVARDAGWPGLTEIAVFAGVLVASLVWLWRVGALDWAPPARGQMQQAMTSRDGGTR